MLLLHSGGAHRRTSTSPDPIAPTARTAAAPTTVSPGSGSDYVAVGVVRDRRGRPVAGAKVSAGYTSCVDGCETVSLGCALTDRSGRYKLKVDVDDSRLAYVVATAGGFATSGHHDLGAGDFTLRRKREAPPVDGRFWVASGTVVGHDGRPVVGARVLAGYQKCAAGGCHTVAVTSATTDANGHYDLYVGSDGSQIQYLVARARGFRPSPHTDVKASDFQLLRRS
ncbi:carboxypeptidase-like regulatory domain-containing protein [Nocardioides montaniterrae]